MADSDLLFKKNDKNILTPEKILEHYNLYIQYIEDNINYGNEHKLQLDVYNIYDYYSHSDWTKLSKKKKKQIPYYLKIPIPSKILPISLHSWMSKFIPYGGFINLCLEDKVTLKRMNIIIRAGQIDENRGAERYFESDIINFQVHNINFREGYFLYDFCLNEFNKPISISQINNMIKNNNTNEANLVLDFENENNLIDFTNKYSVRVSSNQCIKGSQKYDYVPPKILEQEGNSSFFNGQHKIYLNYSKDTKQLKFICVEIENEQEKKMTIIIKIFKREEDEKKNKITLSNFSFKEGSFYYDMKSYKKDKTQSESKFISSFDINKIEQYQINEYQIEDLMEN